MHLHQALSVIATRTARQFDEIAQPDHRTTATLSTSEVRPRLSPTYSLRAQFAHINYASAIGLLQLDRESLAMQMQTTLENEHRSSGHCCAPHEHAGKEHKIAKN